MMTKNIDIEDAILQLIDYKCDKNKRKFAKSINVAPQVISNIVSGRKSKPSYNIIRSILLTYDDINPEWLLTGNGDMLKSTATQSLDCKRCEELQEVIKAKDKQISQLIDHLANLPVHLDSTQIKKRGSSANTNDNAPSRPNI